MVVKLAGLFVFLQVLVPAAGMSLWTLELDQTALEGLCACRLDQAVC
jgi:hypothetical protein